MNSLGIVNVQKNSLKVDTLWSNIFGGKNDFFFSQQRLMSPNFSIEGPTIATRLFGLGIIHRNVEDEKPTLKSTQS